MKKSNSEQITKKSCFVIMPISDMDGYDSGHFDRVYIHLIKPACENAGFVPIRADEVASSNYIVIDILSKIVDSDIVICDLSGRNPNVLYELGIRQAFNLPTVLIKDLKTDKIFDIQGLRYTEYNQALRIDSVEKQIKEISKAIQETDKAQGTDINSLIQLLGVKPASIPSQVELSSETSILMSAIKDISNRISALEQTGNIFSTSIFRYSGSKTSSAIMPLDDGVYEINKEKMSIGDDIFFDGNELGQLADVHPDKIFIKQKNGKIITISSNDEKFRKLSLIPF